MNGKLAWRDNISPTSSSHQQIRSYTQPINWTGHRILDKRTFIGMVEAGEPLIQQAVDAMREYHQAQNRGASAEEIERLRVLAESLFQVVSDYQLRVIAKARGKDLPPLH